MLHGGFGSAVLEFLADIGQRTPADPARHRDRRTARQPARSARGTRLRTNCDPPRAHAARVRRQPAGCLSFVVGHGLASAPPPVPYSALRCCSQVTRCSVLLVAGAPPDSSTDRTAAVFGIPVARWSYGSLRAPLLCCWRFWPGSCSASRCSPGASSQAMGPDSRHRQRVHRLGREWSWGCRSGIRPDRHNGASRLSGLAADNVVLLLIGTGYPLPAGNVILAPLPTARHHRYAAGHAAAAEALAQAGCSW